MRIVCVVFLTAANASCAKPCQTIATSRSAAACVPPIDDARRRLVGEDPATPVGPLARGTAGFDVDRDGEEETLVEVVSERGVTGNASYLLYLSGAGCAHFAGRLFGESIGALDTSHHGIRDLASYADQGCGSLAGVYTVSVFDGTEYRLDPAQTLYCSCVDGPDPKRDPRCPGYE